jgi:hypothetical protein
MGFLQSNLSSTGFDYVVAVTQDSINAGLEELLYYAGLPEIIICYAYDQNNNLAAVDYATFVASAKNTDPFSVPAGTPSSDPRVQNLGDAGFAFAIKVQPGLPPGVSPASLPPIVAVKPGQSSVTYTLMFAEFVATEITYGPRNTMTWFSQAQPAGTAWTFSGLVDLDLADTSFTSLPAKVQAQIKGNGTPSLFSIQQLLYDLDNSKLEQGFRFSDLPDDSGLNGFMSDNFVSTYLKQLPAGAEILGYGANYVPPVPASALEVTDLNFFAPAPVGSENAPATLNYLCAANQHKLPDLTHASFGWNWIEPAEASQYDGVAALNRDTFATYLANTSIKGQTLLEYAQQNCMHPSVQVTYDVGKAQTLYQFGMTAGQSPTVSFPASGSTILSYSYNSGTASDVAGVDGDMGQMKLSSTFTMDVTVENSQIVVSQHLVIYAYVQHFQTSADGNVVDRQITDTYTIGVDDSGDLQIALASSVPVNNSKEPGVSGFMNFWANVNALASSVAQWAQNLAGTSLSDVPVSFVQNFVFPSGKVFVYADACFSDSQDLVSHITYPDLSGSVSQATPRSGTAVTAESIATAAESTVESAIKNVSSLIGRSVGQ